MREYKTCPLREDPYLHILCDNPQGLYLEIICEGVSRLSMLSGYGCSKYTVAGCVTSEAQSIRDEDAVPMTGQEMRGLLLCKGKKIDGTTYRRSCPMRISSRLSLV